MKLYAFYYSPTGGTKHVLDILCSVWDCEKTFIPLDELDAPVTLDNADACIIAVPSFGGRVPQVLIPKFEHIRGNNAKAFLVTVYGNRAFEDTLAELEDAAKSAGLFCCGGAAAVARHSILPKYGAGRPDEKDTEELKQFSLKCRDILHRDFPKPETLIRNPSREPPLPPLRHPAHHPVGGQRMHRMRAVRRKMPRKSHSAKPPAGLRQKHLHLLYAVRESLPRKSAPGKCSRLKSRRFKIKKSMQRKKTQRILSSRIKNPLSAAAHPRQPDRGFLSSKFSFSLYFLTLQSPCSKQSP